MNDRQRNDWNEINLEKIVSPTRVASYHENFRRVKNSKFLQRIVFLRMHLNRTIQSAVIILNSRTIWRYVIRGFFNAIRGRRNLLRSLEIAVTYRCNSECEQCSCRLEFDSYREKTEKMSLEEFKKAIDEAVALGAFQITINGGEPMLMENNVYSLIKYVKKFHRRYVHLCSNGMLMNERKIERLKECGLDCLEMGFDSVFEEKHDANRIKGSYKKIIENIALCKKHGIRVVLNTILTNNKVMSDDIIYTFHLAKKLGCLLQITPCCLTGAFKNRLDVMLTDEAKLYFYWLLAQTWNNRSDLYSSLTSIKCPAGREKIALQPYGDVVSCPLIQIKYGNVRANSLAEIQRRMLKNPYYSKKGNNCLPAMNQEFIKEYLLDR